MERRRLLCPRCGYDRGGASRLVCPECGLADPPVNVLAPGSGASPTLAFAAAIALFASPALLPLALTLVSAIARR